MIFSKRKNNMVDIRELQKRGVVRIPKKEIMIPTNNEGFVELGQNNSTTKTAQSNADFFGFTNTKQSTQQFSTESDGYNKREVDAKIIDLDNKIYKLEQRIELLERKLNVNQQTNNAGIIGW